MAIHPNRRLTEKTKERAKQLRRNATDPERLLWSALRSKQLKGLKFRRQHPIEPFIVDFYCSEAFLVIEIDGRTHDDQIDYDAKRTSHLEELRLKVLRVSNEDVIENLDGVCEMISRIADENRNQNN